MCKLILEGFSVICITTVFGEFLPQTQILKLADRRPISQPRKFILWQGLKTYPARWCWRKVFMRRSASKIKTRTIHFPNTAFTLLQSSFTELIYRIKLLNYRKLINYATSNSRKTKFCYQFDSQSLYGCVHTFRSGLDGVPSSVGQYFPFTELIFGIFGGWSPKNVRFIKIKKVATQLQ